LNITCPHCKAKLNIPDHKIPRDKDSSFKCPKCRDKIQVLASPLKASATARSKKDPVKKEFTGSDAPSARGRERALVCMDDSPAKERLLAALREIEFHVETPVSISEAFKNMAYHIYPLVLVDESFDRPLGFEAMSTHMNELDMSLRRRTCLVLFSDKLPTGDPMSALHSSVNYIVGSDSLGHLEDVLSTALTEHQNFYTVYNESMRAAGKA
jgi:predicted Zn finger-like uncharacterized protein